MKILWKKLAPDFAEVLGVGKSLHNRRLSAVALVHDGWVRTLSNCFHTVLFDVFATSMILLDGFGEAE